MSPPNEELLYMKNIICYNEMASQYLTLLDEESEAFTFQTFDDNKARRDTALTRILHGSLPDLWDELCELNSKGAGIFVCVNQTDLKGRRKENIVGVRSLWIEDDWGNLPPPPVEPQIEVQTSPGKHHRYIRCTDVPVDAHRGLQRRLVVDYGSDSNAVDISRVLRVPGFYNMKNPDAPFLVSITHTTHAQPYTYEVLSRQIPPVIDPPVSADRGHRETAVGRSVFVPEPEIVSALAHLDVSTLGYADWLKVGMALHNASEGSSIALALWDKFSRPDPRYKEGECEYRWSTFDHEPEGPAVTTGTLFKMARDRGWKESTDVNDPRVQQWYAELTENQLLEFNRKYGVVRHQGKTVIVSYLFNAERTCRSVTTTSHRELKAYYQNVQVKQPNRNRAGTLLDVNIVDAWMRWKNRRTYSDIFFRPDPQLHANPHSLDLPDGDSFNLYTGLAISPVENELMCELILKHIREVWCSNRKDVYDYMIKWMASLFQKPDQQLKAVPVLRSPEGYGKNIIVDILISALGDHAVSVTNSEDLLNRFNAILAKSVLVFLNEAVWGGNKASAGKLKSYITDTYQVLEQKHLERMQIRSYMNFMVASNADWSVPVDYSDRRYLYLDITESREKTYFKRLASSIRHGGEEAFIYHLLYKVDLTDFASTEFPQVFSEARILNKLDGMESHKQFVYHILEEGAIHKIGDYLVTKDNWSRGSVRVDVKEFQKAYKEWHEDQGIRHDLVSQHKITAFLKILCRTRNTLDVINRSGAGGFQQHYVLPDLETMREQFRRFLREPDLFRDELEEEILAA